ncbi:multiple sugar transport system substrate-binding protein [Jannaschia seohaensis]|uniref:Multiple sugar transport system substrate-binding protein n=2 Tax=Jannaschia seohaensis TaxID=475081 RepID=A0A2Y9AWI1_9RHOB|nr:multiple sugar transport system substrate-binding protein [Jannaschia seohaensis]SSA48386.1 multiple sugar transport system substrate-binding protein [Jannaschia seohaensis]
MAHTRWTGPGMTRRTALGGLAAASAMAGLPRAARAQTAPLRWWSPQSSPAQAAAYEFQIEAFKAATGIDVVFERTSDEGYAPQLAAAFSSGEVPDVVTHLPSFAAQTYYANGLLEPFNDVIEAIGTEKYYEGANNVFLAEDGNYCATGIGNSAANMLWVRRDLMAEAGIDKIPETWDELRNAVSAMQKGGIYGAPLPYGVNSMTSLIFIGFIHQAGGQVFTPDLQVNLDNEGTRNALEFYKEMREYCPPGATNYSWGESLTAFVSGATATGIYTGRVLINVNDQNPPLADHITCATYPRMSTDIAPWTFNDFASVFIPAQSQNKEAAKQFAAFLFDPPGYIRQLHAAPGHVLPILRTISENPEYQDNAIIQKYSSEVDLMAASAANGFNLGYESPEHQSNSKAGEIIGSNIISEMVGRVVLNGDNVDEALSDASQAIEAIMAS